MAQKSIAYAVARTRVNEGRLITEERILRLLEAEDPGAVRNALSETGYGSQDAESFEEMIQSELLRTSRYIQEVTPNQAATDAFLIKHDCHNAKVILKSMMLGRDPQASLVALGTLDPELLYKRMSEGDAGMLPNHMQRAARELLAAIETGNLAPSAVDFSMDRACFADMEALAKASGEPIVVEAVAAQADLYNLLMALRVRNNPDGAEILRRALLPGGNLDHDRLIGSLKEPDDGVGRYLWVSRFGALIQEGMEEYAKTGKLTLLEKRCDDYILELFRAHRGESFTLAPVIGYLFGKEREAQAVRLVMVAKANDMPEELIKERLRELYA
ncbi:V-type ATPase subunit [Christensenella sp. MSJ-20]|uniref:V-type ATPase subunit n=1 Tax=Christensenella sp. MSJ-20 TaxID=2841518 RepID=UPI000D79D80F|nr:MAG: hypothetical protein DBY42_02320 [Bacillota bacterium]QWT54522.1 V-type ATPase subunit [Christensenella sp. MSJ-20]